MFGVWCEVWGGVTGAREAWLKRNGEIMTFDTFADAEQAANDAQAKSRKPGSAAQFRYTAREMSR